MQEPRFLDRTTPPKIVTLILMAGLKVEAPEALAWGLVDRLAALTATNGAPGGAPTSRPRVWRGVSGEVDQVGRAGQSTSGRAGTPKIGAPPLGRAVATPPIHGDDDLAPVGQRAQAGGSDPSASAGHRDDPGHATGPVESRTTSSASIRTDRTRCPSTWRSARIAD